MTKIRELTKEERLKRYGEAIYRERMKTLINLLVKKRSQPLTESQNRKLGEYGDIVEKLEYAKRMRTLRKAEKRAVPPPKRLQ